MLVHLLPYRFLRLLLVHPVIGVHVLAPMRGQPAFYRLVGLTKL